MASNSQPPDAAERVQYLQEAMGVADADEAHHILDAHAWDVQAAISTLLAAGSGDKDTLPFSPSEGLLAGQQAAGSSSQLPVVDDLPSASLPSMPSTSAATIRARSASSSQKASGSNSMAAANGSTLADARGSAALVPPSRSSAAGNEENTHRYAPRPPRGISLLSRAASLPLWLLRGGLGAVASVLGVGVWAAGGALSFAFSFFSSLLHWRQFPPAPFQGPRAAIAAAPADSFLPRFEAEYGTMHPAFVAGSLRDALRMASEQFKFVLVYLHSAQHGNTPRFCQDVLCNEVFVQFVDEHFVSWAADVRSTDGFQMSLSLRASGFPFIAVVTASTNQRVALLFQDDGPLSLDRVISSLHAILEEQGEMLAAARAEHEQRQYERQLREEQDAAYQAALLADQERERLQKEEVNRKQKEEEERARREREEAERLRAEELAALAKQDELDRRREEKSRQLQEEPAKGPDVTQVVVRLPGGERKERRFHSSDTVQGVYDFVDSVALGTLLQSSNYSLVTNFPRHVFGPSSLSMTLVEAGLHPHANLFIQEE